MIIKKIYINNFGGLSDFSYDFEKELNTICKPNGFGKTTLATFIKAMLYGMPNKNVKELAKNERKKYFPWNNGKYGGFIEFCVKDGEFRLERYFGRTEKDDTITLYNLITNKIEPLTCEIGEKYFEIDSDGFSKTIFVADSDIKFENSSLQTVLTNTSNSICDVGEYESAVKVLDEKRKYYYKNGGAGKINELKNDINNTKQQLDNIKHSEEVVKIYQKNMEMINEEITALEEEKRKLELYIKSNDRQLEVIAKTNHLKSLQNDIDNLTKKSQSFSLYFAKHLPTQEEIDEMVELEKEVSKLKTKYSQLIPNENDLLFYQNKKQEFENLSAKNIENSINLALNKNTNSKAKTNIIFYLLSIISVAFGAFLINSLIVASIALFVLAIVLFVLAISLNKGKSNKSFSFKQIQKLLPTVVINEKNCLNDLFELKANKNKWDNINSYLKQTSAETEKVKRELDAKVSKLNYFLINYSSDENEDNKVQTIKHNFETYNMLLSQTQEKQNDLNEFLSNNAYVEYGANQEMINADEQLTRVENKISESREKLFEYEKKLIAEEQQLAIKSEYERECEKLQTEYDNAVLEYETILKTMDYLKIAKENLNTKYILPMQTNLNTLLNKVDAKILANTILDTDLNVSVEVVGEYKLADYFSKGYRTIINFCTRIAFIKTVYANEKPCIIIDDIFLGLDYDNFVKMSKFIKSIAKDFQIIYLVCSKDRII